MSKPNRYVIRKQRIAPGYISKTEILDEIHFYTTLENVEEIIARDTPDSFLTLAPGEQLIIHNDG